MPAIGFKGSNARRRAWVIGASLDVWEIIESYRSFGESVERVVEETDLSERQVRLALSYYERFPEEIDERIVEEEETAKLYATRFPRFVFSE